MANKPYDPESDQKRAPVADNSVSNNQTSAGNVSYIRDAEENGDSGGLYNPSGDTAGGNPARGESGKTASRGSLRDSEKSGSGGGSDEGGLYNAKGDKRGFLDRGKGYFANRRKQKIASLVAVGMTTGAVTLGSFLFVGGFGLTNFMKNVEQAGFMRYQVDLNGRSSKWLQAYMQLRFAEVDDPNLAPKDRDNLLFRASRVDNNNQAKDWYRTLRASKFEQDVFDSKGIKFTSVAYKSGNQIKFRAGLMTVNGDANKPLSFRPSNQAIASMEGGDPNIFNGELRQFVNVKVYENDKEARAAIKQIVRENYPGYWKSIKRWHLRQDIQNMVGVRKWKFFEKTRNDLNEKKISVRNKIITNSLPDDSITGNFIKCMFGIPDCAASSDPSNPKAKSHTATGTEREGNKTDGNPDAPTELGDGSAEGELEELSKPSAAGETSGKIIGKLAGKLAGHANMLSMLDMLARFDKSLKDHSFSDLVTQAKTAYAIAGFTTIAVAADQLTTGEVTGEEVGSFMEDFSNPTNSEGWSKVVDRPDSGKVAAASTEFKMASNKQQFCSQEHQAEINKPENRKQAEKEYQYSCPKDKIGGKTNAKQLEDAWNTGPGLILHPFLAVYHKVTGPVFNVFNAIASAVTGPVIDGTLSALGLKDDAEHAVASVAAEAVEYGGAKSPIGENTPSGQVANTVIQGGAAMGEASMRAGGGAASTAATVALANRNVLAYEQDQEHASIATRYFALSNPKSLLSRQLFSVSFLRLGDLGADSLSMFGSSLSSSFRNLFEPARAALPDGYAGSRFAGIETFDFPKECLDSDPLSMEPKDATNADDLGIFTVAELSWDMLSDNNAFYTALYDKVGNDEALGKKVWNCALLDNRARTGIGAQYGYKGVGAYGAGEGASSNSSTSVSGDAKEVAAAILANKNVTYIFSAKEDLELIADGKKGTNGKPIDIRALQIVAALGEKHKVVVSAYESHGQGHSAGSDHYTGKAVDLANIDGVYAYTNITEFWDEFSQYAKGAVFLQGNCPGAKTPPSGMKRLNGDACNHQHISFN